MDYVAFAAAGAVLGLVTSERGETTSGQAWRAATFAGVAIGGKLVLDLLRGRAGEVRTGFDGDDDYGPPPPPPVVPPTLMPYPPPYHNAFYYACPDGYMLDDSGQCLIVAPLGLAPPEPFSIEREILYLYPEMIVQYPELRFHPEQLFVFRPELRTRYAGVRSVTEIRSRYREIHHQAPPARPKTAPPADRGRGAPRGTPSGPSRPSAPTTPATPAAPAAHPAAPPTGVTPLAPPPPSAAAPPPSAAAPPTHPALTSPPPGPQPPAAPPPHLTGYYVWE